MIEENDNQKTNEQNSTISEKSPASTSIPDLLNDDFFSEIKTSKKISDKKKKIDELTKSLKENPSYLNLSENQQKVSELYNLLISNLNENNNNYVSSQIKLIDILINNNKDNNNQNFKNFSKQALPKLFDKYYLQNQKINDNLTGILNKFIDNKILNLQDYYPHIENISLEEEDNYRNNIINLLNDQFEKNKDITIDKIPKGIIDIVNKLSEDDEDEVSNVAKKSLEILNNRKQDTNNLKEENEEKKENENNDKDKNIKEEKNEVQDENLKDNKKIENEDKKIIEEKKEETEIEKKDEDIKNDNYENKKDINTEIKNNENEEIKKDIENKPENNEQNEKKDDNENNNIIKENIIESKEENKNNEINDKIEEKNDININEGDKEVKEEVDKVEKKEEKEEKVEKETDNVKEEEEKKEKKENELKEEKEIEVNKEETQKEIKENEVKEENVKDQINEIEKKENEEKIKEDEKEKENNKEIKDIDNIINKDNLNEKEDENIIDEIDENQITEIPELKIEDDLLNIDSIKEENKNEDNSINNDNDKEDNIKDNNEKNDNINKKEESENKENKITNSENINSEDKKQNNNNINKNDEVAENKKEELNIENKESIEIDNKDINKISNENIIDNKKNENKIENNKESSNIRNENDIQNYNNIQKENTLDEKNISENNKENNDNELLKEKLNEDEKKIKEIENNDINDENKNMQIKENINENKNNEKINENKDNNKIEKINEIMENKDIKEDNKNEKNDNNIIEKKESNNKNDEQNENNNIEKKESTNEFKDNNNQENKKEGGVKRSAIQGKLNKFRKQFGKTRKSKNIESVSKELDKQDSKTETKKDNNINDNQKTNNENKNDDNNKNINKNENNSNEIKINENIINKMISNESNEIRRTNTLEEMFKKKNGFDTETNNILDLGNNHNNNNNSNVLNEIQDKLGINFNEIINSNNNINNDKENIDLNEINKKNIISDDNKENNNKDKIVENKNEFNEDNKHDSKKFIDPDDRPIHPSTSNFNFDLDFEEQEKIFQMKDLEIKEKKMKKLNSTRPKFMFENKDLEKLGKMDLNKNSKSKNESNSGNKYFSAEIDFKNDDKKISPFNIENNNVNKIIGKNKDLNDDISNTLNNINDTINNLSNLNIIKKNNDDERRPKIKVEDFQKKLELALEQEQAWGDNKNTEENNNDNNDNNDNNEKEKKSEKLKEDPRFDNIKSILGKEIVDSLFSQRWENKKHGYELINNSLESDSLGDFNSNDLYDYLRLKLKNFKETNFNVNREAFNVFITMSKKKIINKDNLISTIIAYYDKITDYKLKDNYIELLNSSFSIVEPNVLIKQILTKISKKNNVKLFIEYSLFFGKIVEDYSNKDLPYKEMTEFSKIMANNTNPQVRNSGTNLICILYKYYGEEVHKLIRDIKESTLKNIEAELSKVTIIEKNNSNNLKSKKSSQKLSSENEFNKNANLNGGEKEINGAENGENKANIICDISKKITPQILKDISDGKWAEKKEACEQIEKILQESKMKILPNGLNDLMNLIKKKLTDGNKNIVRMMVNLLTELIEALKQGFKQWSKYIALNLIPNLSDKNTILRNECQICFDKWVEFVGFDTLIVYFPQFLKNDNLEIRTEIMNFINKYKNKFNKENGVPVFKEMTENLLLCLQDRSLSVRAQAEDLIKFSLKYIKLNIYYEKAKEYKPAITKDLTVILDKIQDEINENNNSTKNESNNNNSISKNNTNDDIENESNININELINSNNRNNGNGASNSKNNKNNSNQKKEDSNYLKSNSTILSTNNNLVSNLNINTNLNKKFKKSTNKLKTRKSLNSSIASINSGDKNNNNNNEKEINAKATKTKELPSYKTCSNFKKKKTDSSIQKSSQKDLPANQKLLKTEEKKKQEEKGDKRVSLAKSIINNDVPSLQRNSTTQRFGFSKLKGISNSLILKKTGKNKKEPLSVFLQNVKVVPNKSKRLEKDLKFKFSLDYICKDSSTKSKLKDICKNLFVEDFNRKIFSEDFKKQVIALKEMKEQLDKKINIPIYFDNLDLILKIIGIYLNGNINPTLVKNLFEFLESLYIIIVEKSYTLNEIEINIILTLLIDKLSLNNNTLRDYLIKLLDEYIELNDINKIMKLVLNIALGKNSKIKTDILDYTYKLYLAKKLNIMNKQYVKIFGKYICSNDNAVKTKVLILFKEIYSSIGEELFNILDFLTDKDMEFLQNKLSIDNNFEDEQEVEIYNKDYLDMNSSDDDYEENDNNDSNDSNDYNDNNINDPNMSNNGNNNITIANGAADFEKIFLDNLNDLLSESINSIIFIHEEVCSKYEENKSLLLSNIDLIINNFIKVTHKLFIDSDLNKIPTKFAKYIATTLLKITANKELISKLSYEVLYNLSNELLSYLLINDLNQIGEKQEGVLIFKSINSSMIRIIDNCDKTSIILILLEILKNHLEDENNSMSNLSVKCLLKSTEKLNEIINGLDMNKIFIEINSIIFNCELKNKYQRDSLFIKFIQNFINNVVKIKGEETLEIYNNSIGKNPNEDKHILHWIKGCLNNINKNDKKNNSKNTNNNDNNSPNNLEDNKNNESYNKDNEDSINENNNNSEIKDNKDKMDSSNKTNNNGNDKGSNTIDHLKKKWNDVKKKEN